MHKSQYDYEPKLRSHLSLIKPLKTQIDYEWIKTTAVDIITRTSAATRAVFIFYSEHVLRPFMKLARCLCFQQGAK